MGEFSILSGPARIGALEENKKDVDKSFILATLQAIKLQLYKLLNIQVEMSFSDYVKQQWKLNNRTDYPRSYITITSFELIKDRVNNRAFRTGGITAQTVEVSATGNYLKSIKVAPIRISFELHYFDSDISRAMLFIENLLMISALGGFSFSVSVQDLFDFQTKASFDENISLQQVMLSDDANPGSTEIVSNFTLESYAGIVDDTPRAFVLNSTNLEGNNDKNIKNI